MDNSPNLLILKHTLTKMIFNIKSQQGKPTRLRWNWHQYTPWYSESPVVDPEPPNPGAFSRHTTLSGAGNTQIHQEEDISYVYNISAQGRNGNSNSHRTLIVLNLYLVCGKMSSSWHEMTVVRTNTVKPTRATARSQTYTAWVYHLQHEMGKDCLPIFSSTNFYIYDILLIHGEEWNFQPSYTLW